MKKCPICGSEMIEIIDGSSRVIKCTKCDYNVATSEISLIYEDETIYTVTMEKGNNIKKNVVTTLKNIVGFPTSKIVEIIKNDCPYVLYTGSAVEVNELKSSLDKSHIRYSIKPEFKW